MAPGTPELTAAQLRAELHYDPETGVFTWLGRRRNTAATRRTAGSLRSDGYLDIFVGGRRHRAHRLAWLYVYGEWPKHGLDHRDGRRANNRIANLRDVPPALNSQNRQTVNGIEFRPGRPRPYRARLWADGKLRTVGSFTSEAEARSARQQAAERWHPGHLRPA